MIIGGIIFIVLVLIQFIVINKGSERVSEVTARFTLDAMPGKQMAIDADLNTGTINEKQARERREKIQAESSFFGAMDGATKYVKGDAVAGLIITFINLIGGTAMGMMRQGLPFADAIQQYGLLTIGDGLVSQIPSLVISLSTGILVTKASKEADFGEVLIKQLFGIPKVLYIVGATLIFLGIVTPLNPILFVPFGAMYIVVGRKMQQTAGIESIEEEVSEEETEADEIRNTGECGFPVTSRPDRVRVWIWNHSVSRCQSGWRPVRPCGYDSAADCVRTWYCCANYPIKR